MKTLYVRSMLILMLMIGLVFGSIMMVNNTDTGPFLEAGLPDPPAAPIELAQLSPDVFVNPDSP